MMDKEGVYSNKEDYVHGIQVIYNGNKYADFRNLEEGITYTIIRPVSEVDNGTSNRVTIGGENLMGWNPEEMGYTKQHPTHGKSFGLAIDMNWNCWNSDYRNFTIIKCSKKCLQCNNVCKSDYGDECPFFEKRGGKM